MKKKGAVIAGAVLAAAFLLCACGADGKKAQETSAAVTDTEAVSAAGAETEPGAAMDPGEETGQARDDGSEAAGGAAQYGEGGMELPDLTGHALMIYCGAGMTKPFQEIADAFKEATGCEMNVTYANAGQIQSQIKTSEEGDLFIAGSGDELKPVESYVASKTDLVKHIPVLAVQSGNPKNITGLKSLTEDGVKLVIGDVEATPIGKIAKKALSDAGIFEQVQIEATTATAPQMTSVIAAGEADAAIVWKENCGAEGVAIVDTEDLMPYTKTVPAASLSCSADPESLDAFGIYLSGDDAKAIWIKYGYEIAE